VPGAGGIPEGYCGSGKGPKQSKGDEKIGYDILINA